MGMSNYVLQERQERWQAHFDYYMRSIAEAGPLSLTAEDAAERYADEMMEEEQEKEDAAHPEISPED